MESVKAAGPDYREMFALFPGDSSLPAIDFLRADALPQPYRDLLVHEEHMTVTVEAYHHSPVDVRVLARVRQGDSYARKILLVSQRSGAIVQFGMVRIWLNKCSKEVREQILAERTPLGRILIQHEVLRRIEPTAYLRVLQGPATAAWFGPKGRQPAYGRLGYIHCDGAAAIELMEVVAPE
jgi:chorismate-pyruvate lyase